MILEAYSFVHTYQLIYQIKLKYTSVSVVNRRDETGLKHIFSPLTLINDKTITLYTLVWFVRTQFGGFVSTRIGCTVYLSRDIPSTICLRSLAHSNSVPVYANPPHTLSTSRATTEQCINTGSFEMNL